MKGDGFRIATVCALTVALLVTLGGCGIGDKLRCSLMDARANLKAPDPVVRARAAQCVRYGSAERAADAVPELLELLDDRAVFYKGMITTFEGTSEGELIVAMVASYALREATPRVSNIVPMVDALVHASNQLTGDRSKLGLWGETETVVRELLNLLRNDYASAGLGEAVASAMVDRVARITNPSAWSNEDIVHELDLLAMGRATLVAKYKSKFAQQKAEAAAATNASLPLSPLPSAQSAATKPPRESAFAERAVRRGMTWSLQGSLSEKEWATLGCHGQPKAPMSDPHNGGCNPYRGDTTCDVALPLLCVTSALTDATRVNPDVAARLGSVARNAHVAPTLPILGRQLASQSHGDALCAQAHGVGWRMLEFHDGGGWALTARVDNGSALASARAWVAINDQPGNCWDR